MDALSCKKNVLEVKRKLHAGRKVRGERDA